MIWPYTDPLPSTEWLRRRIERPTRVCLWGESSWSRPRLVDEIFGDGLNLIRLYCVNFRPHYWVMRIDSSWSLSNWDDGPLLIEHIEDIEDSIEEQFGNARDCETSEMTGYFPMCDFFDGVSWASEPWPEDSRQHRLFNRCGAHPPSPPRERSGRRAKEGAK